MVPAGSILGGRRMSEFFAMGGYAFYVWGAYGVAALVIVVEVMAARSRSRTVLAEARLGASEEAAR
jgi:heme exporter protein D